MNLPSKLLEDTVNVFAGLPGIGKKTALRLTLHLMNSEKETVQNFSDTISKMRKEITFCSKCHNIADPGNELCNVCLNPARNNQLVCIVEGLRDLIAIESTNQFNGTYHILGGVISPVDGIGPDELNMQTLLSRIETENVKELIMALSPTIEGDTTIYYISKKTNAADLKITAIARGISFGGELEYVDELTLSRSLTNRLPFDNYLVQK
jgi:recombination protein RecR